MGKPKPLLYKIADNLYRADICVFFGGSYEAAHARLEKICGSRDDSWADVGNAQAGVWYHTPSGVKAVWFRDRHPTTDVICHEAIHLSFDILSTRGLLVTPENHEALTYHVQWLVSQITAKLKTPRFSKNKCK